MKLKYTIIGILGIILGSFALTASAQVIPFTSKQLAPTPVNLNCLFTNGSTNFWSTCSSGGGGGSGGGTWSTTTSSVSGQLINYSNNTTDIPCIGGTATTTCKFFFDPNTNRFIIVSGNLGVGTTTPGTALSVNGNGVVTGDLVVRSLNATSTTATSTFSGGLQSNLLNITSSTASSTFANGINLTAGCYAILSNCLSYTNLAGNVPVAQGGTGSTTLGGVLAGNGSSGVKSAVIGTGLAWDGTTLSSTGGGGGASTYPFTPTTNFGANTNATTGVVWFQNGLQASTTSSFDRASSTAQTVGVEYNTSLTAARVMYSGTNGKVVDDPDLTFDGTALRIGAGSSNNVILNSAGTSGFQSQSDNSISSLDSDGSQLFQVTGNRINKTSVVQIGPPAGLNPNLTLTQSTGILTYQNGYFNIGTSTNTFNQTTIASTTAPQLSLSSGAGFAQVTQRGVNGNFYIATTSTSNTYATSSLAALTILQNGGFGIATNTPGTILSIGNNTGINFDISTSTFNTTGGININSGCFSVRSTCITGGTGATVDTGGFNFAYPFPNNATSTQLTFSAGLIATNASTTNFIATTTLGVATSTPGTPLSVTGAGTFTGQVEALNFYATSTTATSTFLGQISGNRVTAATARFTGLVSCDTIDSDLYGNLVCGTDATGAGGSVTGNGITGMMTAWSSGSNIVGTSTIIGERFVATSTTAASSTIPNLALTNLQVTGNAEIGVPRYPWLSGMLLSVDSTGLTEATGTPTAGFFNATSTTASSTFQGTEVNLLHVRSTTASSTFENGINLTKGCFAINSVCITGGAASSASTTLLSTDSNTFFGATTTFNLGLQANGYTNFAGTTTLITNTLHTVENKVATGTTMNIDWGKGNFQTVNISTSAITLNFTNPTYGDGLSLLVCNQSSGTAGTITWGSLISWPGGIAPGQTTAANQCDLWSWRYSVGTSTATVGSAKYFLTGLTSGYQ